MTEPLRICYLTPGVGPCGGIRVIFEHVNRLVERGHNVVVAAPGVQKPRWMDLNAPIAPFALFHNVKPFDAVVATGYQTVDLALKMPVKLRRQKPCRYYFVQMMEHEFFDPRTKNYAAAQASYALAKDWGFQVVTIARWLKDTMEALWELPSIVIGNGVNREDFYPDGDKQHAILVEGDARNRAKDIEEIGWRVAMQLREEFGVKLWGFAAAPNPYISEFDHFQMRPTTAQMRQMYSRALFLLKASRYEGRACAPVEAMACGTTSTVAIVKGSDDLIGGRNCLRVGYDYRKLLAAGRKLLTKNNALVHKLTIAALAYADEHLAWDPIIDRLEAIYAGSI
jgi:glycosyltransferase involved in cell wall biosynthesis